MSGDISVAGERKLPPAKDAARVEPGLSLRLCKAIDGWRYVDLPDNLVGC